MGMGSFMTDASVCYGQLDHCFYISFSHVDNVPASDGPNLRGYQRRYSHSFTGKRHELHLGTRSALVDMHDCADFASLQAFGR